MWLNDSTTHLLWSVNLWELGFVADIADDEQNIETHDVETVKLAELDETRHL
jgi:hypothetical protein